MGIAVTALCLLAAARGQAATLPTITIQATTPQLQENFKDIGGFKVTRTGGTDTTLRFFYDVSDAMQTLTFMPPTGLAGQYFSGPICPLNVFMPKGTTIGYIVQTPGDVDNTTNSDCVNSPEQPKTSSGLPYYTIKLPKDATLVDYLKNFGASTALDNRIATIDVAGLASANRDFVPLAGEATFSIGQQSTVIPLIPVQDDETGGEGGNLASEALTLTLTQPPHAINAPGTTYTVGTPSSATIVLNDGPAITATATQPFAASPGSGQVTVPGELTFSRAGDVTAAMTINATVSGTAVSGTDYQSLGTAGTVDYNILALGMSSGYISGPMADPNNPPAAGRPIAYLVSHKDEVLPADGCICQLPAHRIPIPMPAVPEVGGSPVGGVTKFGFKKNVGDAFKAGDVLATFEVSTVQISVAAGDLEKKVAVTPLAGGSSQAIKTVTVTGMFLALQAPAGSYYLSGPLAGPDSPPPVGKPIAYLVPSPSDVVAADSDTVPGDGIPVKMVQYGSGTSAGAVTGFTFEKLVGQRVNGGDTVAMLQIPAPSAESTAEDATDTNESADETAREGATVYIRSTFVPPLVDLWANQAGENRRLIAIDGGNVTVTPGVLDLNPSVSLSYDWSATDNALTPTNGTSNSTFAFDPSGLAAGLYTLRVTVTDSAQESGQAALLIKVVNSLPSLDQDNDADASLPAHTDDDRDDIRDSDGDFIPDVMEGYADSDGDGIPDYLDSNLLPLNALQEVRLNSSAFVMMTDPGLALQLGDVAFAAGSDAANVTLDDIGKYGGPSLGAAANTSDSEQSQQCIANPNGDPQGKLLPYDMRPPSCYPPYVYQDFNVTRILVAGGVAHVVIPQLYALPAKPLYRVFYPDKGWQAFQVDANNKLASCCGAPSLAQNNAGNAGDYPGSHGNCPPPGSTEYTPGLSKGDMCVELTIQDGGPDDTDGAKNHVIKDPSVIASEPVPLSDQQGSELIQPNAGALGPVALGALLGFFYVVSRRRRR